MIRVFIYLAWRSAYNRVARQLRQLRSPRYLAALALGLSYLWIVAVEQRPRAAPSSVLGARWLELLGALGVVAAVLWGWIFGVERRVLAFTPAEVTFLFSGPVPRRGLVQYKLLRNQLLILFNSLLWTLILARERFGASPWLRALSVWVLLTTVSFHRLGASFVRTSLLEHGRIALRHRLVSLGLLGTVLVGMTWSVRDAMPSLAAGWAAGLTPFLDALAEAASEPLPRTLLLPFKAIIRPLAAHSFAEWVAAMGPALVLLLMHYVWVIRADTAFEEAAAEASLRRAHLRASGGASSPPRLAHRRVPRLLQLAPLGWPAGAILWKNLLAVVRTRRARSTAGAFAVAGFAAALLSFESKGTIAEVAGWLAATWAAMTVVIGPQWVRNDLRSDLLKLDLLRSYPLAGRAVVAAETAGSTVVLTALQLGLLLIAYLAFLGNAAMEPDLEIRTIALVAAVVCLPGINYLGMLIQNGTALLFPAWTHLGSGRPGGVEALGQNMLMIVGYGAALAVALAVPALLGAGVFVLLRGGLGWWSAVPAAGALLAGALAESIVVLRWLGRVYERTDPAEAGIAA
ncbi:MAG TPA: putative ABC exporter domain-containing protein [Gemmatimonadales bacterium]|nr:putative ABC exporter domain-containing protein [Gemmatimonadales bacterium]